MTPLEQAGMAIVAALTTAVVALWGLLLKRQSDADKRADEAFADMKAENESLMKRIDDCEADRLELWKHINKLEVEIATLRRGGGPVAQSA